MGQETAVQTPYAELLVELDGHVRAIRESAFRLKGAAGGVQGIDRNVDRLLASVKMLEINIGDILGTERTMASWTEDDAKL